MRCGTLTGMGETLCTDCKSGIEQADKANQVRGIEPVLGKTGSIPMYTMR